VPHSALVGEVRIVQESVSWLSVANHAASVISKRIVEQFLVAPDVLPPVGRRVLSRIVDEHGWVQVLPYSLFEVVERLSKEGRALGYAEQGLQSLPGDADVAMIVGWIAPILADGPLLLPAQETAMCGRGYR
jgi:hypothetical protein